MDLTEAEDIKMAIIHRRTIQKDRHDLDNHDGVITHLRPDILEYSQADLRKHHYEQS